MVKCFPGMARVRRELRRRERLPGLWLLSFWSLCSVVCGLSRLPGTYPATAMWNQKQEEKQKRAALAPVNLAPKKRGGGREVLSVAVHWKQEPQEKRLKAAAALRSVGGVGRQVLHRSARSWRTSRAGS